MTPDINAKPRQGTTSSSAVSDSGSPTRSEPVAIVGMACRFPGAADLDSFWQLLVEGKNAVTEITPGTGTGRMASLFPEEVQNEACRFGAFVEDIEQFDAGFFRISPAEAEMLDPQQRMMLELSWLALEDAGMDPLKLKGSRTGVYTGISNDEYRMLIVDSVKPAEPASSLYALSGTNLNGCSGRVSFFLGLMGPSKAVDAACASAMVAVHDAVADLQQGKADLAIAGGVQAILNGRIYELRADSMMLSPDGQCKTFDASANGYVRGEGCGVVVLKRLKDAVADGDQVWAVIRGVAVNHGGASSGLTVPHTPALEQVMKAALQDAGVTPADVDFLEAHGTGTGVGDPVELNAVANVYGHTRENGNPLLVGSVKTNIGHTESAAGIAGLIKAALALKKGVIPKHLHFHNPSPSIDWDRVPLQVTSSTMDWPRSPNRPRLAGVNSFGISGTNAHIVVGEYHSPNDLAYPQSHKEESHPAAVSTAPATGDPQIQSNGHNQRRHRLLPLSGKSEGAVGELAERYLAWLDEQSSGHAESARILWTDLSNMAWTASVGRSHFERRAGVPFHDEESLRKRLTELVEVAPNTAPQKPAKIAFVYTGQGSQWSGMGRTLYETEPVARAVLDRCEEAFRKERGSSLLDVMFGREEAQGELCDTDWEQPALYALECALTALWASVGVRPSVTLGHSVGEIAAAQAAGVFSLEDGMRFAANRGSLLSGVERGAMAAVFAPASRVIADLERFNNSTNGIGLSISADNGSHQVISGPVEDVEVLSQRFESEGIRAVRLNTKWAFHSAMVEPALDELEASLDCVRAHPPHIPVISNLTGQPLEPDTSMDGAYWRRHAREPVAFAKSVISMADLGVDLVIEIGPHSVLGPMIQLAWPQERPAPPTVETPPILSSLRRPPRDGSTSEPQGSFIDAVAEAYQSGLDISLEALFTGETRRRISLPGYPFQRERHWLESGRQRRSTTGHPLLGVRHESARGDITFESQVFPSDPAWLKDHRVFGRLIAPGALYGAIAATASRDEVSGSMAVEDMQLHSPLVFSDKALDDNSIEEGRTIQAMLDSPEDSSARRLQIFSKGSQNLWTMHVECSLPSATSQGALERTDLDQLKTRLSPADSAGYYRAKAKTGIDLGPLFRTLKASWSGPGEALGEIAFPESLGRNGLDIHPLLLDGCFQVVGLARNMDGGPDEPTYLPFGWERFWLNGPLPDRIFCHVVMSESSQKKESNAPAEVLSGELRIYNPDGVLIGGLSGYSVKQATRQALLAAIEGEEGIRDLLYEVVWRESPLETALKPANFFPSPSEVANATRLFPDYLIGAGVDPDGRNALLRDLERWSWSRSLATLEELGWRREIGEVVDPEGMRQRLGVLPEHKKLFRRMLELSARGGALEEKEDGFVVLVGHEGKLPDAMPEDLEEFDKTVSGRHSHGQVEIGLFRRSGKALAEVLRGNADPLTLLFSSGEPTAADLYLKAPVARAANELLAHAVRTLLSRLPGDRKLRVLEVGAGTGSATASVLPELPEGSFSYTYTDISAGFFAEAESRFGDGDGAIEYLTLDIEKDPVAQGFHSHGYDLIIASNVLHATQYLQETLGHCMALLAPSGQLVALENMRGLGWMDLTFGQLDGWWRFADSYRPHHALVGPTVWRRALADAGFEESVVLGPDESQPHEKLDKGVIVAQGPAQVTEPPGVWVLAGDHNGFDEKLSAELAVRNQTVLLATAGALEHHDPATSNSTITMVSLDMENKESWHSLFKDLPRDIPLKGIVHLRALSGNGIHATTGQMGDNIKDIGATALAMTQGLIESDLSPENGLCFVTRGAQVLERENSGEPAGATLWGLGKVVALESPHLQPRMIDLNPAGIDSLSDLVNDLLYPDQENHIAYRLGNRMTARLVRLESAAAESSRLALPDETEWVLVPDRNGVFESPEIKMLPARPMEPREVRVSIQATGLNFWDVFRSLGFIEEGNLGREMCGYVIDVGSEVTSVSVGDHVVGLGFGAFAPEMITHEALVAPAPEGISVSGLASIPSAFVSAALSFRYSGLEAGDRVLIHAGAGGVGLAAIQLVQAAGAEVFATASAPKQEYLRSLGVEHVFDSRTTNFGREILEATNGEGVHVILNSLTSEGFIDASLSCLAHGGRFVELARRDILTEEEMAALRPDVSYAILELDVLKKTQPDWVGEVLREVMGRVASGELTPLSHSRWPLAEAGAALSFMRSARHVGKIVLTTHPLTRGKLRDDRTYLVTGGLGGIGCAVAGWLADNGAGAIVLNGRRDPDPDAEKAINELRSRGIRVEVELADVTDASAVDAMLARINDKLPPLAGVIHSVGVLSDAALTNQTWASFEQVLHPKILGAWHLHRSTMDRDLDLFILFSSRVGVMGNPGQANHAAANAFLDQLAAHRRALGLPGQSIAWGAWSEIGEAAEQRERIEFRKEAWGSSWFSPKRGLQALDNLVRQDITNSAVMSMDWPVFEEAFEDRPPFLDDLLSSDSDQEAEASSPAEDLLSSLRSVPATGPADILVSFVQQSVQAVLRLSTPPSPTVGFFDLGMDSLMSVELRNRLNRALAGEYVVSNTAVFDYPNVASLANHLAGELGRTLNAASAQPAAEPAPLPARALTPTDDDPIAIVGMACRFPGAPDLSAFWNLLQSGGNAITDARQDPGPWKGVTGDPDSDDPTFRRGGFVQGLDLFDNRFFRISPMESRMMDPRQRMLLETTWQALEDAGIDPECLKGSRTGVYAGMGSSEYRDVIAASGQDDFYFGTSGSMTAGRIAFILGLEGPAMPVDLACTSSLAAVHQASTALQRGEINMALVGAVNVTLSLALVRFHNDLGLLSAAGQCNAFDANADGFVRSEGCGVLILKKLSQAEADGDRIWGLVKGSALNQNGASAGLPVPNGPAQVRVIEDALSQAGVTPSEVDYVEAHGAGSELGDSIELRALASVYGRDRNLDNPLLLGSVKTNIGHAEWASGLASIIKSVLAMNRGVIPAHLHFQEPNPNFDWDTLPVKITSEMTSWPGTAGRPLISAVNSFGLSGANAHVVLESYISEAGSSAPDNEVLWPAGAPNSVEAAMPIAPNGLSAPGDRSAARTARMLPLSGKSPQALQDMAHHYVNWLNEQAQLNDSDCLSQQLLADMAWTAGIGRSHFPFRRGLVFRNAAELKSKLENLINTLGETHALEEGSPAKTAFIFAGNGAQGMAVDESLYNSEPVVRAVLDRCDQVLRQEHDTPLLEPLFARRANNGNFQESKWTFPEIYSLQVALAALWESVGVKPSIVLGHGIGEVTAAQVAGVLTMEDGLRLAASWPHPDGLADTLPHSPPSLTMISSASGNAVGTNATINNEYWQQLARNPGNRSKLSDALTRQEPDIAVVLGPLDNSGSPSDRSLWSNSDVINGSLNSDDDLRDPTTAFLDGVAAAYERGARISFPGLFAGESRRRISIPTYSFQRRSFWVQSRPSAP